MAMHKAEFNPYAASSIFRIKLLCIGLMLQACSMNSLRVPPDKEEPSLKEAAKQLGLEIGVAVDAEQLSNNAQYAALVRKEFSFIVPENAMKLDALQPHEGVYSFEQADRIVSFAKQNGLSIHGHTLVWHRQIPQWILNQKRSSEEAKELLRVHIEHVLARYSGDIASWDILNEAVGARGGLHSSYWLESIGSSYIPMVFIRARKAAPQARLYYNENDVAIAPAARRSIPKSSTQNYARLTNKSETTYRLLKKLIAKGIPLDGVGLQMHIRPGYRPTLEDLKQSIKRFSSLGLDVRISELDVSLAEPVTDEKRAEQAKIYAEVFEACLSEPQCKAVNIWGLSDAHSWIPHTFNKLDEATIFDTNLKKKPAYYAILKTLRTWCKRNVTNSPRCAK